MSQTKRGPILESLLESRKWRPSQDGYDKELKEQPDLEPDEGDMYMHRVDPADPSGDLFETLYVGERPTQYDPLNEENDEEEA